MGPGWVSGCQRNRISGNAEGALCPGTEEALREEPWSPEFPDLLSPILIRSLALPLVTPSLGFCVF